MKKNMITVYECQNKEGVGDLFIVIKPTYHNWYIIIYNDGQSQEYTEEEFKSECKVIRKKAGGLELFGKII